MFKGRISNSLYQKIYPFIKGSFLYWPIKKLFAEIAKFTNDNPSQEFFVVGVTWTNGKTTTSALLHHLLNEQISKTLLISSAGIKIWNQSLPWYEKKHHLTTFDINSLLAIARDAWCQAAVLEISAVELDKFTYEWIQFDAAVLTNCTDDHLNKGDDFHNYVKTKKKLFQYVLKNNKQNKFAVFPKDDKTGREWTDSMPFDKKITFGINSSAVLKAENIQQSVDKTQCTLAYLGKTYTISTKLLGSFNVYNILAAIALCIEMGITPDIVIPSVYTFQPLQQRLARIQHNNIDIFTDISYSPDALDKSLSFLTYLKKQKNGKLIIVFGTPGNKDQSHRTQMGKILQNFGDILVATDSEPGTENRLEILYDLSKGVTLKEGESFFIIPERSFAIQFAVEIAQDNDIILFAGRPRWTHQHTNLWRKSWNDKETILKALEKKK